MHDELDMSFRTGLYIYIFIDDTHRFIATVSTISQAQ